MKQILHESSKKLKDISIFEQGSGKLDILSAYQIFLNYKPKITFYPSSLDLTKDVKYMWPFSSQPIYETSMPLIINVTILNGMSVSSKFEKDPIWLPGKNGENLDVKFEKSNLIWPWVGHLSLYIRFF
jgi:membrane-bound transcription factor site-1 protease